MTGTGTGSWWRGAVLYQIYPRSFMDTNGDGIGDLKGITAKLDHVKSLGVDGVWLSPFFKSPMRDFGYDVSDYRDVDPMFGTLDDFKAVLKAAHERQLKVIIDQVWSHTSSDHAWFQESRQDRTNAEGGLVCLGRSEAGWRAAEQLAGVVRRADMDVGAAAAAVLPAQLPADAAAAELSQSMRCGRRSSMWRGSGCSWAWTGSGWMWRTTMSTTRQLRDNPPSGDPAPALPRNMQLHTYNSNQPETLEFVAQAARADGCAWATR